MTAAAPDWRELTSPLGCTPASLAELLDGGQAFRWYHTDAQTWIGQWSHHLVELRLADNEHLQWRAHTATDEAALRHYLRLDDDTMARAHDGLPWRSDAHLAHGMDAFPGLRILRQPFGETLLAFLCSATKQIPQIKQMLALLAERHGTPVVHVMPDQPLGSALPTWEQLAQLDEAQLRDCQLGFRARYIAQAAQVIATEPDWLTTTASLPYAEAKARLMALPGVGEKIADCVALFGLGHLEAFPVDTWMLKAMARRYDLESWSPAQVAHFGRTHYGPAAGLAQQYLFAWERAHGGR